MGQPPSKWNSPEARNLEFVADGENDLHCRLRLWWREFHCFAWDEPWILHAQSIYRFVEADEYLTKTLAWNFTQLCGKMVFHEMPLCWKMALDDGIQENRFLSHHSEEWFFSRAQAGDAVLRILCVRLAADAAKFWELEGDVVPAMYMVRHQSTSQCDIARQAQENKHLSHVYDCLKVNRIVPNAFPQDAVLFKKTVEHGKADIVEGLLAELALVYDESDLAAMLLCCIGHLILLTKLENIRISARSQESGRSAM